MRYCLPFPGGIPHQEVDYPRVTHPYATLLRIAPFLVRLACVKRAASVDSEPGSNSRLNLLFWMADLVANRSPQFELKLLTNISIYNTQRLRIIPFLTVGVRKRYAFRIQPDCQTSAQANRDFAKADYMPGLESRSAAI